MKIKYKDVIQANKQDEAEKGRKKEKTQKPEKSQPEWQCVVAHPVHRLLHQKMTNMTQTSTQSQPFDKNPVGDHGLQVSQTWTMTSCQGIKFIRM